MEDKLDSAIIKIVANHTREYNELDTTYKKLGVKHLSLLRNHKDLVENFTDLKILCANLTAENKALRKLLEGENR